MNTACHLGLNIYYSAHYGISSKMMIIHPIMANAFCFDKFLRTAPNSARNVAPRSNTVQPRMTI